MYKTEILTGGRSAASVVRKGDMVHRTKTENYAFIHSLLVYLEEKKFSYAPRFLGLDEEGREKLSFIEGRVPCGEIFSDEQLQNAIMILRQFHDICSESEFCGDRETICHNDFAPWNMVFQKNIPVGFIDFDEAAPGDRIDDVAYFLWTFLDFGVLERPDNDQINSIIKLSEAYALKTSDDLVEAILKQQHRILQFRKDIVMNEKDEEKVSFSQGAIKRIKASMDWINLHRTTIKKALQA